MKKFFVFACVAAMLAACAPQNEKMTQCKNGFMDLARARFAVREYAQKPVEQAKIDSILEAGRLAPTAKNVGFEAMISGIFQQLFRLAFRLVVDPEIHLCHRRRSFFSR